MGGGGGRVFVGCGMGMGFWRQWCVMGGGCPQLVCGCRVGDEISQMLLGGICSSGLGWFSWLAWRTGPVAVSLAAWSRVMRLQVAPTIHSASTPHPPTILPASIELGLWLGLGLGLRFGLGLGLGF